MGIQLKGRFDGKIASLPFAPKGISLRSTKSFLGFTVVVVGLFVMTSCGGIVQQAQRPAISAEDTRMIIDALIEDLPLPPNSEIRNRESVILGSGYGWGGRIGIDDPLSPAETLLFFR